MEGSVSGHLHTFVVRLKKKKKKLIKEEWMVDFNKDELENSEGLKLFIEVTLHQQRKIQPSERCSSFGPFN